MVSYVESMKRVYPRDGSTRLTMSILFYFFLFFLPRALFAQDLSILEKIRQTPALQKQMQAWVEQVVREWRGSGEALAYPQDPLFQKPLAVFITAKKGDEVRGCMGTLQPQEKSLADEIRKNLRRAFTQDPRHRPIQKSELPGMEIYVSAVGDPQLLTKPYQVNPARDAILMRSGSKEAIALPGEAKTLRYLLAFLKSKAGIKKSEPFQLYRLRSESLGLRLPASE